MPVPGGPPPGPIPPFDPTRPSVFVVVGTDHHPFDRLVHWVDDWLAVRPQVDGLVQSGTSAPPVRAHGAAYLRYGEVQRRMRAATVVVCHGGPGTIMDCRAAGKVPVVVPRRSSLGEHVDDHQVVFCDKVAAQGVIRLAQTAAQLHGLLDSALADPAAFALDAQSADSPGTRRFAAELQRLGPRPVGLLRRVTR